MKEIRMKTVALDLLQIIIGIAGGIAVGSAAVAFLVILGIIPRLVQLTKSYCYIRWYELAVVCGSLFWSLTDFFNWRFTLPIVFTIFVGILAGCFVGLLAAALTEIINVLPIIAKRMGLGDYILWLLAAMVLGKVIGSLFEWLIY